MSILIPNSPYFSPTKSFLFFSTCWFVPYLLTYLIFSTFSCILHQLNCLNYPFHSFISNINGIEVFLISKPLSRMPMHSYFLRLLFLLVVCITFVCLLSASNRIFPPKIKIIAFSFCTHLISKRISFNYYIYPLSCKYFTTYTCFYHCVVSSFFIILLFIVNYILKHCEYALFLHTYL